MARDMEVIELVEVEPGVFELPRTRARQIGGDPKSGPAPGTPRGPRASRRSAEKRGWGVGCGEPQGRERFVPPERDESLKGTEKVKHELLRARNVIGALVFDDPGARDALIDDVATIAAKIILGRTK